MVSYKGRCMDNEDDISAEEETKIKGSWFQGKNEHTGWKEGTGCQKSKGKKAVNSLGRIFVAFSSILYGVKGKLSFYNIVESVVRNCS